MDGLRTADSGGSSTDALLAPPHDALVNMRMLDQRPAEAADRAVPGHWEGDLIVGADNRSAVGTVVDRASRFTMWLHLSRLPE